MNVIKLGGIIDISTKDIPGKASMVLFTVGCNFKCDYCHNKYLLQPDIGKNYQIEELVRIIESNSLVSGVSITGGEPTLQNDLLELCKEIKKIGKYISIDTNGYNTDKIKAVIPFVNRIALDLKGPLNQDKYESITRVTLNLVNINQTIDFLNTQEGIDFEIRTTYLENILTPEDFGDIIYSLKKREFKGNFVLQQYQYSEGVGVKYKEIFLKPEHDLLVKLIQPFKSIELPFKIFLRDEIVGYCNINKL